MSLSQERSCACPLLVKPVLDQTRDYLFDLISHYIVVNTFSLACYWFNSCRMVFLKDIIPAATNNVNTKFIILEKGNISQEGKEITCVALVADETASVHFQMWGGECEAFEPGDIVQLTNGIFSYHKNNLVLRAGKRGTVEKVSQFTMLFVESPNLSEIRWGRDANNPKNFLVLLRLFVDQIFRFAEAGGDVPLRLRAKATIRSGVNLV
ncbi:hypothetical protein J5N97_015113 [Dioscorea zingiberensis]|uniref:SOSS complex subunit B homolog n=1 Tax=Dioscorea zingiberensis TaxID=325984 RepID=A0A9D5HKA1_9LILI|nr:hypothetical protein J5N97_015113 [Dioscorea zingiberensis]